MLNMVCYIWSNKCSRNSTDLKFVFNLTNGTKISVSRRHTTVVNATTVELNYPNITLQFNGAVVTCRVRGRGTLCRDSVDNRLDVGGESVFVCVYFYSVYLLYLTCLARGLERCNSLHVCLSMMLSVHAYCLGKWAVLFLLFYA